MPDLSGTKVAFLVANEGVEELELAEPWRAVEAAGGEPVLVAPEVGKVQAYEHLDAAGEYEASVASADARAEDFVGLVLPGGVANPDQLRTDAASVALCQAFASAGKPIAVICHGPWTLVEAGLLDGRTVTSWPSLRTDIQNAGGEWVDEEVHVSDHDGSVIVSSRRPDDLPAFCATLVETFGAMSV